MKYNGIHYKLKAGVTVAIKRDLRQTEEIFVVDNIKIRLKVTQYWTYYESHYCAYTLSIP